MKKKYYDEESYNYIKNKLDKTKINSIFKPLLIDIILRRKYEYQLENFAK